MLILENALVIKIYKITIKCYYISVESYEIGRHKCYPVGRQRKDLGFCDNHLSLSGWQATEKLVSVTKKRW